MPDKTLNVIIWFLGFGILYAVSAHFALSYLIIPNGAAAIWPASGVSIAAFLLSPRSKWWLLTILLASVDFIFETTTGALPYIPGAIFSLSLTFQALASAWILQRYIPDHLHFGTLKEVFLFIFFGCVIPSFVFAVPPAIASMIFLNSEFLSVLWSWSVPSGLGVLIVCPSILLIYPDFIDSIHKLNRMRQIELFILLVLSIITTWFVFTTDNPEGATLAPYSYLVLPVLLLVAIRFNPSSTILTSFIITATALWFDGAAAFERTSSLIALEAFLFVIIAGALLFAALITERKKAESELLNNQRHLEALVAERTRSLADANEEIKSFSYSVSHDLRAPLRVLNGFTSILIEDYSDKLDNSGKIYLERIKNNVNKMQHLIEDMLSLSMAAQHEIIKKQIDLSSIVNKTFEYLSETNTNRDVGIEIENQVFGWGDERLLTIVIDNLLSNSWKYTEKKVNPYIKFFSMKQNNEQVYVIKDNGAGFDMKFAKNIFRAFQRQHSTSDFEGTGIGLATVARIINRHGGRIWTKAKVDKGAAFYFTLPQSGQDIAKETE